MIVTEREDIANNMLEQLRIIFGFDSKKRNDSIHVSDLVYCLRKYYLRRRDDIEQDPDDDSVLYFIRGRSLHDLLEKMFETTEHRVRYKDVVGTVDAIAGDDRVIEIKTTKSLYNDMPNEQNLQQLWFYMAMLDANDGVLLYYEVLPNRLRYFAVHATDEENAETLKMIDRKRDILKHVMDTDNVLYIGRPAAWECRLCRFSDECDRLEYENDHRLPPPSEQQVEA